MVLQVSKIIDDLMQTLLNYFFKNPLLNMFNRILVKKGKLDHKLVNFNLIENINTLRHDSK
jgi:hypothetical protein